MTGNETKKLLFNFNHAVINFSKAEQMMQEAGRGIGFEDVFYNFSISKEVITFIIKNGLSGREDDFFESLKEVAKRNRKIAFEPENCRFFTDERMFVISDKVP